MHMVLFKISVLASSTVDRRFGTVCLPWVRYIVGLSPGRVKPKTVSWYFLHLR